MILWNMEGCVESELFQNLIHQWVLKWNCFMPPMLWWVKYKFFTGQSMHKTVEYLSLPQNQKCLFFSCQALHSAPHWICSQFPLNQLLCCTFYIANWSASCQLGFFNTVIPVCLFGPEKPRQGRGQLSTHNCCHHVFLIRSESVVRFVLSM